MSLYACLWGGVKLRRKLPDTNQSSHLAELYLCENTPLHEISRVKNCFQDTSPDLLFGILE